MPTDILEQHTNETQRSPIVERFDHIIQIASGAVGGPAFSGRRLGDMDGCSAAQKELRRAVRPRVHGWRSTSSAVSRCGNKHQSEVR